MTVMSAATSRAPRPPTGATLRGDLDRFPLRADDVRVLSDRVVGDEDRAGRRRATAATRLAAAVIDRPELLTPAVVRRLDAALPGLVRAHVAGGADAVEAAALAALCAALGDRLSAAVCPPLQGLVRTAPPHVAVAAHVASLLVEGLTLSTQHLSDLAAIAEADPYVLAATRRRPSRVRAAALAYALAAAQHAGPGTPGAGER
jgi:hypothetical protein